ncbi:MAG: peroxiredoxin [Nanoarchaeota archaeon]|nr:peroxiredoxin [Nanoarchaeota archaeon]
MSLQCQWVVVYFYPKDATPGCTVEAVDFSSLKKEFSKLGVVILGVSKDTPAAHQKFIKKESLTIQLLSDVDGAVHASYQVWGKKQFMGKSFLGCVRSTFLINRPGLIVKIWNNVSVKGHAADVLATLRSLQ